MAFLCVAQKAQRVQSRPSRPNRICHECLCIDSLLLCRGVPGSVLPGMVLAQWSAFSYRLAEVAARAVFLFDAGHQPLHLDTIDRLQRNMCI